MTNFVRCDLSRFWKGWAKTRKSGLNTKQTTPRPQGESEDIEMKRPSHALPARALGTLLVCTTLVACNEPLDFDLRGNLGAFSTATAARGAALDRPQPDARGVISYPSYQVVVARQGDTVRTIADRLGIDPAALARYNGIDADTPLRRDELLSLPRRVSEPAPGTPGSIDLSTLAGRAIDDASPTPPTTSITTEPLAPAPAAPKPETPGEPLRHKVERGETAYTIARLYAVPVKALAEWNGLGPDFTIREGQYLLIPLTTQEAPVAPPPASRPGAAPSATPTPPSASRPLPNETVAPANTPVPNPEVPLGTASRSSAIMDMPVDGRVIRAYAKGRNDGIDIAGSPGAAVRAAKDGNVAAITSDAEQVPIIVVRHSDNVLTVYANVDNITVSKGDSVKRGQKIAQLRAGDDAYVHFEVREGFDSVDPTPYLE